MVLQSLPFCQVNSQLISNVCTDALSAEKVRCTRYHPNIHLVIENTLLVLWAGKSTIFHYRYLQNKNLFLLLRRNSTTNLFNLICDWKMQSLDRCFNTAAFTLIGQSLTGIYQLSIAYGT